MPNDHAIARPNKASSTALQKETQRGQIPAMSATPSAISAVVDAQARKGMLNVGMKELTLAVYCSKLAKFPQLLYLPHSPNRSATADRNDTPSARRA